MAIKEIGDHEIEILSRRYRELLERNSTRTGLCVGLIAMSDAVIELGFTAKEIARFRDMERRGREELERHAKFKPAGSVPISPRVGNAGSGKKMSLADCKEIQRRY